MFVTDDMSFHGQPQPVNHPDGVPRNSVAAYYCQSKTPVDSAAKKRTGTDYVNESGNGIMPTIKDRAIGKLKK